VCRRLGGIGRYAQIVREHALMRRLLSTAYEIPASVLNHQAGPRELVEQAEQRIFELLRNERAKRDISLADAISEELDRIHEASQSDREYLGLTSGLRDLDELTNGWQPGNLTVLASRPGMGKSSVALNFATHGRLQRTRRSPVLLA
jgi:replicative DNA helicase